MSAGYDGMSPSRDPGVISRSASASMGSSPRTPSELNLNWPAPASVKVTARYLQSSKRSHGGILQDKVITLILAAKCGSRRGIRSLLAAWRRVSATDRSAPAIRG
jgi:hypothetical protein